MPQSKHNIGPTIILGVGFLIGGLLGAASGFFAQNETTVIACYVIGVFSGVGGAIAINRLRDRRLSPAVDERPQGEK